MNTLEVAPPRTPTSLLVAAVAAVSVASGLIHFAAVPEHWADYRIAAVFFVGLGIFQVVWAPLVLGRPSRLLYGVGAAASLLTIGIWITSRTSGLPFGPFAGVAERAGRADIISTLFEEVLVVVLILLAFRVGEGRRHKRRAYPAAITAILGVTASLTIWAMTSLHAGAHGAGAGTEPQVSLLSELAGHHGLHLLFAGGAVMVYLAYVVGHVRRHGWPPFSWRLNT